ncbi:MAG TPA: class III extradiol dioxygenase subunit B-like domain-containing protein [Jiangellaceae bacterium]|nr:class III extradiol dioxygenase subunit B-like domain-containing protein [Jiangellaceae bacterium]
MLVSAAVCPHPPLLVPDLAEENAEELEDLRVACLGAIDAVRATEPQLLLVVGTGAATRRHRSGARGSFASFGLDLGVALPGGDAPVDLRSGDDDLPLALAVGAWLLEKSGWTGQVRGLEVDVAAPTEECRRLGASAAQEADRVGLLVMGDGSARRSTEAPGYFDPRAEPFDASVVEALRAGDPTGLLTLDPALATELQAAGRAAWQVLAGASGEVLFDAEVVYDAAPYGVGYVVAVWERHG